jgi:aldehyde dehydrogenase (NAD+)
MAPWNYPFELSIVPMIGSMSAGNCSILKPSAYASHTSAVMARLLGKTFAEEYIGVIEGGREENKALLDERFDYICFTGSEEAGKTVMAAAAKYLTPVTLELNGKSPCLVDEDADLDAAAKRIVWGKFLNAGQTCVAPDYVLAHSKVKTDLIKLMRSYIELFYGTDPLSSPDYIKIITEKHVGRLLSYLDDGQASNPDAFRTHKIAPAILDNANWDDPVMQEEIFGPILPVLTFDNMDEILRKLKSLKKPLACYYFTKNKAKAERLLREYTFGGGCINDTVVHVASSDMPFGGVGSSGMGGYHGKYSFETFSHQKSILKRARHPDVPMRYPPYGEKLSMLKKLLK